MNIAAALPIHSGKYITNPTLVELKQQVVCSYLLSTSENAQKKHDRIGKRQISKKNKLPQIAAVEELSTDSS